MMGLFLIWRPNQQGLLNANALHRFFYGAVVGHKLPDVNLLVDIDLKRHVDFFGQ
jgi:hypothetical protein